MAKNRKNYERGNRITVYLNKHVGDDLINYMNNQSDIQAFFLYAAMELNHKYGDRDISQMLPRNFQFTLDQPIMEEKPANQLSQQETNTNSHLKQKDDERETNSQASSNKTAWEHLNVEDDEFA